MITGDLDDMNETLLSPQRQEALRRVEVGAQVLEQRVGPDAWKDINLMYLMMESSELCPLAQATGLPYVTVFQQWKSTVQQMVQWGFFIPRMNPELMLQLNPERVAYNDLDWAWREFLKSRIREEQLRQIALSRARKGDAMFKERCGENYWKKVDRENLVMGSSDSCIASQVTGISFSFLYVQWRVTADQMIMWGLLIDPATTLGCDAEGVSYLHLNWAWNVILEEKTKNA